jgi:diguanylate cyclase (GGDEF)-like protein
VTLAVLFNGRRLGYLVALICAGVWLLADLGSGAVYSSTWIPVWNTLVRLGYFSLNSYLIGRLTEVIVEVKELSLHDPLTKTANWRFFEEYTNKAIAAAIREKKPITFAYVDLDDFKVLNDRYGHGTGDEALVLFATTIREGIRPEDMLARLGGDEFVIFLPGPGFEAADLVLRRLHAAASAAFAEKGRGLTLSVGAVTFADPSLLGEAPKGVASSEGGATLLSDLLAQADDLLYEAKRQGKNVLRHEARP